MLIQIVEDDRALSDGIVLALGEQGTKFVQCSHRWNGKHKAQKEKGRKERFKI